jgi:hypothetical protein
MIKKLEDHLQRDFKSNIFFRSQHLVLGGNQYKVTIDVSYNLSKRLLISERDIWE